METITDEFMLEMMGKTKAYTLVILRAGPNLGMQAADKIVWEHARRNFLLREKGLLSIVMPIRDGSDIHGVGIFDAEADEVAKLMDEDPGVTAGLFVYEVHASRSFPGDRLPG